MKKPRGRQVVEPELRRVNYTLRLPQYIVDFLKSKPNGKGKFLEEVLKRVYPDLRKEGE